MPRLQSSSTSCSPSSHNDVLDEISASFSQRQGETSAPGRNMPLEAQRMVQLPSYLAVREALHDSLKLCRVQLVKWRQTMYPGKMSRRGKAPVGTMSHAPPKLLRMLKLVVYAFWCVNCHIFWLIYIVCKYRVP